jgi:hypothetical protein
MHSALASVLSKTHDPTESSPIESLPPHGGTDNVIVLPNTNESYAVVDF